MPVFLRDKSQDHPGTRPLNQIPSDVYRIKTKPYSLTTEANKKPLANIVMDSKT